MKKKFLTILLCISLLILPLTIYADVIEDLEQQKTVIEEQQSQTVFEINLLENQQSNIQGEISETEELLIQSITSISMLDEEIEELEEEVLKTEEKYNDAIITRDTQYESMKKRIQYIYENGGDMGWAIVLLSGDSISDLLNKKEYTEKMYDYDRKCLEEYAQSVETVINYRNELYVKNAELNETKRETEEEKRYLEGLLAGLSLSAEECAALLEDATKKVEEYQIGINLMNARIEQTLAEKISAQMEHLIIDTMPYIEEPATFIESVPSQTFSEGGQAVVNFALQFVGYPYVWGGNSLTNGVDCSGFTQQVYQAFGFYIPRTSSEQRNAGIAISESDLQPGDLVVYPGHVAIYIGDGAIIHASNEEIGITISPNYAYRDIIAFRRIVY